jgi:hypothetical protein
MKTKLQRALTEDGQRTSTYISPQTFMEMEYNGIRKQENDHKLYLIDQDKHFLTQKW